MNTPTAGMLAYVALHRPFGELVTVADSGYSLAQIEQFKKEGRINLKFSIAGIELFYQEELNRAYECSRKLPASFAIVPSSYEQFEQAFNSVFRPLTPSYQIAADRLFEFYCEDPNVLSNDLQFYSNNASKEWWSYAGMRIDCAKHKQSKQEALFSAARAWRNIGEWTADFNANFSL